MNAACYSEKKTFFFFRGASDSNGLLAGVRELATESEDVEIFGSSVNSKPVDQK